MAEGGDLRGLTPNGAGWGSKAAVLTHLKTLGALFYVSVIPGFVQPIVCAAECSDPSRATFPQSHLGTLEIQAGYKFFPQPSEPHRLPV